MRSSHAAYASVPTGGGEPFAKFPRPLSEELMQQLPICWRKRTISSHQYDRNCFTSPRPVADDAHQVAEIFSLCRRQTRNARADLTDKHVIVTRPAGSKDGRRCPAASFASVQRTR